MCSVSVVETVGQPCREGFLGLYQAGAGDTLEEQLETQGRRMSKAMKLQRWPDPAPYCLEWGLSQHPDVWQGREQDDRLLSDSK